jgi:hypothetical protein
MATKKRSKGARAAASRAKSTARPRAAGRKTKATVKPKRAVKARPAKAAERAKAAKAAKPKRAATAAAPAPTASKERVAHKNRFQRERSALEKNLTEAVREIGLLRHHEMRVAQLEHQLKERDDLIGRLQRQLEELQRRPAEPIYEREVQQSFALVSPPSDDVDEFEDDVQLVDETQLEDEEA